MDSTLLTNPIFALEAYGIQNPFVREAMRLGAWGDVTCWKCRGDRVLVRQVLDLDTGKPVVEPCDHCRGLGFIRNKQDDTIYAEDFGDETSWDVAERFFGMDIMDLPMDKTYPTEFAMRPRRDVSDRLIVERNALLRVVR